VLNTRAGSAVTARLNAPLKLRARAKVLSDMVSPWSLLIVTREAPGCLGPLGERVVGRRLGSPT
jgi:hypothetical protein